MHGDCPAIEHRVVIQLISTVLATTLFEGSFEWAVNRSARNCSLLRFRIVFGGLLVAMFAGLVCIVIFATRTALLNFDAKHIQRCLAYGVDTDNTEAAERLYAKCRLRIFQTYIPVLGATWGTQLAMLLVQCWWARRKQLRALAVAGAKQAEAENVEKNSEHEVAVSEIELVQTGGSACTAGTQTKKKQHQFKM